jgi:opacity protein-like surface antigen
MKKIVFIIIVVFGFQSAVVAQSKGDVEFGFNVGYNYSTVSDEVNSADSGYGFNVGASADYYFSSSWSLKTKVIYDQKGWNNGFIQNSFDPVEPAFVETNFNLNYVTVPVMANWHFGNTKNWYLNFGPYVGFLVSADETRFDTDLKEAFNSTDFGLSFGIGVKIPVSDKLKLSLEYEGQGGFTDIFADNPDNAVQNTRGSFNVGLNFLLK